MPANNKLRKYKFDTSFVIRWLTRVWSVRCITRRICSMDLSSGDRPPCLRTGRYHSEQIARNLTSNIISSIGRSRRILFFVSQSNAVSCKCVDETTCNRVQHVTRVSYYKLWFSGWLWYLKYIFDSFLTFYFSAQSNTSTSVTEEVSLALLAKRVTCEF